MNMQYKRPTEYMKSCPNLTVVKGKQMKLKPHWSDLEKSKYSSLC